MLPPKIQVTSWRDRPSVSTRHSKSDARAEKRSLGRAPLRKRASEIISLPKGEGALHGIGEKFSPDLFTGTGNFTIPIALPPGRNGFQPQLSLGVLQHALDFVRIPLNFKYYPSFV
jgi:hypothetical protein